MSDFLKQGNQTLFPKILWNKPVNKRAAKRLLIIGGQAKQFQRTQDTYQAALEAGIGVAKVVLPDAIKVYTGELPDCVFVPSTKAGSIAKAALPQINSFAAESDGLLLAGELSQNSETLSLIESLLDEITLPLIATEEVINGLLYRPQALFSHPQRLLIAGTQTLVKLAERLSIGIEINSDSSLLNRLDLLKALAATQSASYATLGHELIIVSKDQISVTPMSNSHPVRTAAFLATYWLQHPDSFQALTSGAYVLAHGLD